MLKNLVPSPIRSRAPLFYFPILPRGAKMALHSRAARTSPPTTASTSVRHLTVTGFKLCKCSTWWSGASQHILSTRQNGTRSPLRVKAVRPIHHYPKEKKTKRSLRFRSAWYHKLILSLCRTFAPSGRGPLAVTTRRQGGARE